MRRRAGQMAMASLLACTVLGGCTAGSEASDPLGRSTSSSPSTESSVPTAGQDPDGPPVFAVVTHGAETDPFWGLVKTGAEDAGDVNDVAIDYQSDPEPAGQARLVDAAVVAGVDGLIVSMPDPDALREPIARATQAGIPVVTINAGAESSAEFGALTHVGQSDLDAGRGAGQRLQEAGVTTLLCVVQDSGDPTQEERCQGAADGFGSTDLAPTVLNLQVNGGNLSQAETTIATELATEPQIDGILTLNASVAMAATAAVRNTDSPATVATFELDPDVQEAIRDGEILFAVDQQEYLQGYLPVVILAVYLRTGTITGTGQLVPTGPRYVTADNVDTIVNLSATRTR